MSRRPKTQSLRPPVTVGEFFAGIGLVRLAMEQAGFRVVYANDIDPNKQEMYCANFGSDDFLLGDIHEIDVDSVPTCDVFTASFPCNDLSIAGGMKGLNGANSGAFWGLVRILEQMGLRRPSTVLLENVPGFLQTNGGDDFAQAISALNSLGYACDVMLIDAERFVPQSRLRLFVIAAQGDHAKNSFILQNGELRPHSLMRFIHAHPELVWSFSAERTLPNRTMTLADIVERLPDDDPAWWNEERASYFMNQLSERHLQIALSMINGDVVQYGTAFRRVRHGRSMAELRTDGVAGCLRTPRGGSGRQILFAAGQGQRRVRLLTARECARLQGAPDDFVIDVGLNQALFGFGDAVCVPVVRWIAENYLRPLVESSRPSGSLLNAAP